LEIKILSESHNKKILHYFEFNKNKEGIKKKKLIREIKKKIKFLIKYFLIKIFSLKEKINKRKSKRRKANFFFFLFEIKSNNNNNFIIIEEEKKKGRIFKLSKHFFKELIYQIYKKYGQFSTR
jgi:hypothetical protein